VALWGCAEARPLSTLADVSEDPAMVAQHKSIEAAASRFDAAVNRVEVRLRDLGTGSVSDGVEVLARLPFETPWSKDDEEETWQAELRAEVAQLDVLQLNRRVTQCQEAAEWSRYVELDASQRRLQGSLEAVERWSADWNAAGNTNDLEATEFALDLRLTRLESQPTPIVEPLGAAAPLPLAVEPQAGPLATRSEVVRTLVSEHHPSLQVFEHLGEAWRHRSQGASDEALPWLDFVQLGYGIGPNSGLESLTAQLAVIVPFGSIESADSERFALQQQESELERAAALSEFERAARTALIELVAYEALSPDLAELNDSADDAVALAELWMSEGRGDPRTVAGLVKDAQRARTLVIAVRARWAQAQCRLLESSGVSVEAWPRGGSSN